MSIPSIRLGACVALALAVSACQGAPAMEESRPPDEAMAPTPGFVTDMPRFEGFIETRPTPEEFRRVYPDVLLVLPGQIATKELRFNNSRYFAELDANGRIVGGRFQ